MAEAATLEDAISIAAQAHRGQRDKAGAVYLLHPLRLMLRMDSEAGCSMESRNRLTLRRGSAEEFWSTTTPSITDPARSTWHSAATGTSASSVSKEGS